MHCGSCVAYVNGSGARIYGVMGSMVFGSNGKAFHGEEKRGKGAGLLGWRGK